VAYLIDTTILIHARDGMERVLDKLAEHDGAVLLSALCLADVQRGLHTNPAHAALRRTRLERILSAIEVIPFDAAAAEAYARIVAQCGWLRGRDFDRMIAGHAISSHSVLVTDNFANFADIPNLPLVNWVAPTQ
jgi:tRNA(fMet)-specific endonuclease VapC